MLFNGKHRHVRALTPAIADTAPPGYLHGFGWRPGASIIGGLDLGWSVRASEYPEPPSAPAAIMFTNGGPWFSCWRDVAFGDLWRAEERLCRNTPAREGAAIARAAAASGSAPLVAVTG